MTSPHRAKGRGHDATGRTSRKDDHHFRLYHWFADLPAWRDLSTAERCVYLELELRFFGHNNGAIALSARDAAKACRISKDTAVKCFGGLIAHGFTICATPGGFSTNGCKAPEWRLTRAPCNVTGERATNEFKRWKLPAVEAIRRAEQAAKRAALVPKRSPKIRTLLSENKDTQRAKTA